MSVAVGSVCASPSSITRLVSAPARSTVRRRPPGAVQRRGLLQQRRGAQHPGQAFDAPQQAFVEAVGAARAQLQRGGADDRVHDFLRRAGDAAADEDRREHERHRDRDAEAREQLLHGVHAQAAPV